MTRIEIASITHPHKNEQVPPSGGTRAGLLLVDFRRVAPATNLWRRGKTINNEHGAVRVSGNAVGHAADQETGDT